MMRLILFFSYVLQVCSVVRLLHLIHSRQNDEHLELKVGPVNGVILVISVYKELYMCRFSIFE